MSNSSSNKKSNNNKEEEDINDFQEFMPYWKKEEEAFANEAVSVYVERSTRGGGTKTRKETIAWPRVKPVEQRVYEDFMAKITNPSTNKFYSQRDSNGNQIKQEDGKNARYVIKTIVRIKRSNGKEYLYSMGQLQGFDAFGSPVARAISKPEVWTKTEFLHERRFDVNTNSMIEECKGPISSTEVYELEFNQENVDKLYKQTVGMNNNKLSNTKETHTVQLVVKDEQSGVPINVAWSSLQETLNLFKTKEFEYLYNSDYIPAPVKAELRAKSEGLTNNNPVNVPKLEKDNKNYKGYTL